jgi:hypothetical protein
VFVAAVVVAPVVVAAVVVAGVVGPVDEVLAVDDDPAIVVVDCSMDVEDDDDWSEDDVCSILAWVETSPVD